VDALWTAALLKVVNELCAVPGGQIDQALRVEHYDVEAGQEAHERRQRLVELLMRHYKTVHSLGRLDPTAPIDTLAAREHTDDVLVY